MENKSLKVFFVYLGISMVVSAVKVDIQNMTEIQILTTLFRAWNYNFVSAVPGALVAMIITDIYLDLKKNVGNEKDYSNSLGVFSPFHMAK